MGTKYSSQSSSGYNSSPPADDGSQVAANKITWATIKTKLSDVLKTFIEAVNSALVTALDVTPRQITASGSVSASDHARTVEIARSVVTGITVTLADAATMATGFTVTINNQSAITQTIARATSGDGINGTAADIQIGGLSALTFKVNASANGYSIESYGALVTPWTTPAFSSGDFTGSGSMTWTVGAGNVTTFQYRIVGKTMTVIFSILGTTVAGTPSTTLRIKVPASASCPKTTVAYALVNDNGTSTAGYCQANGTLIAIGHLPASNFLASSGATEVYGQITFEIT